MLSLVVERILPPFLYLRSINIFEAFPILDNDTIVFGFCRAFQTTMIPILQISYS